MSNTPPRSISCLVLRLDLSQDSLWHVSYSTISIQDSASGEVFSSRRRPPRRSVGFFIQTMKCGEAAGVNLDQMLFLCLKIGCNFL